MESEQFLYTRFKIFGLLVDGNQSAVEVDEYKEFVNSEQMQHQGLPNSPKEPIEESISDEEEDSSQIFDKGEKKVCPTAITPSFKIIT